MDLSLGQLQCRGRKLINKKPNALKWVDGGFWFGLLPSRLLARTVSAHRDREESATPTEDAHATADLEGREQQNDNAPPHPQPALLWVGL